MMTRREYLAAGSAALLTAATTGAQETALSDEVFDASSALPHKAAFFPIQGSYLNSASQHPLSRAGREAVDRYLDYKSWSKDNHYSVYQTYRGALDKYASLINASVDEVCYVQSTTVGENLILKALGYPGRDGGIVTDELHYVGSLPTYDQLAEAGVGVTTLRTVNGRIEVSAFEKAVSRDTRLVAISSVSMVNGFRHDLKRICEIAHANGAMVYADVVHEVGNMPFDVRESGVDFCSAASYKWLMGEQGLGFLYVRKDRLQEITRPWFGHYQYRHRNSLAFPNPSQADSLSEYEHFDAALGYFAMGSQANVVAALLDQSLQYLIDAEPRRLQAYRQPMIDRLQDAMPSLGFPSLTPRDTGTAIVSFRHDRDPEKLHTEFVEAGITVTVADNYIRISPSVFNEMDDIGRLLDVLSGSV